MKQKRGYKIYIDTCFDIEEIFKRMISKDDSIDLKERKKNTIEYIMNNYEAGAIYFDIKNGEIVDYFALVNLKFRNKWSQYIKNQNYNLYNKNKEKELKTRIFEKNAKLKSKEYWTKNGGIINMFNYGTIFNSYQLELVDLIKETVKKRKINNTCFILWTKDIPLLNYTGIDKYIKEYKWPAKNKYIKILSQSTAKEYLDIAIPNSEEWTNVRKLFYPPDCKYLDFNKIIDYKWNEKIEKGFFRGSSTGYYNDFRNPRLKVAQLGQIYSDLLDCGISKFVRRDKIENGEISYIKPKELKLNVAGFVNNLEFGKYKYIINIEGNGLPYRKSSLFFYKSVVLDVESEFKSWFETTKLMTPFVHYIPIAADLSDLIEKIEWCKENDSICKKIAENGYKFAVEHFNINTYLNYMEEILNII